MHTVTKILGLAALLSLTIYSFQSSAPQPAAFLKTNETDFCPEPEYRSKESFNALLKLVKDAGFKDKKLQVLEVEVPKDPRVFSKDQVLAILEQVSFSDAKAKAIDIMNNYIMSFTTDEVMEILSDLGFDSVRLDVLAVIANTLSDASDENKEKIIKSFGMSSSQNKARDILKDIANRNCIFGYVTEKVATFVIDISPSMQYTFVTKDGQKMSRLEYVKQQLAQTIDEQLKDYQKFNIVAFGSTSSKWMNDNVSANRENIDKALKYVKGLGQIGGTNLSGALANAFGTKEELEGIYLLSDGYPNSGISKLDDMARFLSDNIQKRVSQGLPKVRIFTTSFMLGGTESEQERQTARQFMQLIAETTNGSYRAISDQ